MEIKIGERVKYATKSLRVTGGYDFRKAKMRGTAIDEKVNEHGVRFIRVQWDGNNKHDTPPWVVAKYLVASKESE